MSGKALMHAGGESNSGVVPTKQPNKNVTTPAEVVEGRPLTKENTRQPNPCRTPSRESGPSRLERVREAAKKDGKLKFTALLHHVSIDLLRTSYHSLKKQAAPGVDGVYRAQPSRRVWIQKPMAANGHWGSRRWRTRSSSTRWGRFSTRSGKRTF